jgi:hypothetical protein
MIEVAHLSHTGRITAVAFSDGGRYVATASNITNPFGKQESYPVRVRPLRPEELLAEANARLDRLYKIGRWSPASRRTYR